MRKALITGSSGFIGFHLCKTLLENEFSIIGVDNMSDYYDVKLKESRLALLKKYSNFEFVIGNIETPAFLSQVFEEERPEIVVHLAAQAGVRHSIENPRSYLDSNLVGTFEVLEASRSFPPKHLLIASTSSAYGANTNMPFNEKMAADHQLSFYAATKKATENMAHSYSHLFRFPITMFRFFTVYGPWGRPDMALFKFTKAILSGNSIDVYNHGNMQRDFTYVSDLVEGIRLLLEAVPTSEGSIALNDSLSPVAPWRIVNIGNGKMEKLTDFIGAIERATGCKAIQNLMPMQDGDVHATFADVSLLKSLTGYAPKTEIVDGVNAFVKWYREYYKI